MTKTFTRDNKIVMLSEMVCKGNDGQMFKAVSYDKYLVQDNRLYMTDKYTYIETPIERVIEILEENGYVEKEN